MDESEIKSMATKITLKSGMSFNVGDAGDIWTPSLPLKNSQKEQHSLIKNMKINQSDILMAGYPKGGSNWTYQILNMLQQGSSEYCKSSKPLHFLEAMDLQGDDTSQDCRVLNTHLLFRHLPTEILEKKTPILYFLRNPKSAIVSLYYHMRDFYSVQFEGTWPQMLDSFALEDLWYGNWFDYVLDWEKEIKDHSEYPIFTMHYEELLKDTAAAIYKLSEFLGLGRSEELCREIADACRIDKMRDSASKIDAYRAMWKEGSDGFYRKGDVSDWKNWFTVAQNEWYDCIYRQRMEDSELAFKYSI